MATSRWTAWNVPGRVDKHSQRLGLKALNDLYVRGCGAYPVPHWLDDESAEENFVIYR